MAGKNGKRQKSTTSAHSSVSKHVKIVPMAGGVSATASTPLVPLDSASSVLLSATSSEVADLTVNSAASGATAGYRVLSNGELLDAIDSLLGPEADARPVDGIQTAVAPDPVAVRVADPVVAPVAAPNAVRAAHLVVLP
ncbi:hypothetical protein V7S43_010281 [Phytophthora oleae]|uniref:Uncharacterized protein n=1 Tax=Phytophthora oleae TaxID=2107226 RepID=A0ABD3FCT2_9STRA